MNICYNKIMKTANFAPILMLSSMFFLMIFSSVGDSATFDEVAHIPAGFSYLTQKDGRLNPEHPPLIKEFTALPLFFLNLNSDFVKQNFWTLKNVNDRQWAAGNYFLYEAGNDPDKILFWSRLPIIILTIIFGFITFWWTKKNYGLNPALLTLFLYALSPTFLAHGRFVTTDLGAALAFFLSTIFFIWFLDKNDKKSAIYFGVVFGFSLLVKFSLIILLPFFLILLICPPALAMLKALRAGKLFKNWKPARPAGGLKIENLIFASLIALTVIYIFYIPLTWNYSIEQNLADAHYTLGTYKTAKFAPQFAFTLISNKWTQPLGQYLHGFLMVAHRTAGGNNAYFWGEISSKGWVSYFPTLFLTKEQIGLIILILLSIIIVLKNKSKFKDPKTLIFLAFIAYYWAWSLWSPLNIGIRHILPTLPFIYILISKPIIVWLNVNRIKKLFVSVVFAWMALEISFVFPYFVSYFNAFAGGYKNGYKIATDSNYDWGQDLKRLKIWMQKNNVEEIYLDYFGGGSPKYYLGSSFKPWYSAKGFLPIPSPIENRRIYFAVSINILSGVQAKPVGDLLIKPEDSYAWLKDKKPIARAGSSIFIFQF